MKTLQDIEEQTWKISADWEVTAVKRCPQHPKSLTLLLHGMDERGLRIYRKLLKFLPEDSYIVAPNAPFPLPRMKSDRLDFGYAWYFYNRFTRQYHVDQSLALNLMKNLLQQLNPQGLPVYIVGFSQGGYLAPLLAYEVPETKLVIGIGCEFRTRFFNHPPQFSLVGIHGEQDPIISYDHAEREVAQLKAKGIDVEWHLLAELKHEINLEVGEKVKTIMEQYGKRSL